MYTHIVAEVILPAWTCESRCNPWYSLGIFSDRGKRGSIQSGPLTAEITLGEPLGWFNHLESVYMWLSTYSSWTIVQKRLTRSWKPARTVVAWSWGYFRRALNELLVQTSYSSVKQELLTQHHAGKVAFFLEVSSRWHLKLMYIHLSKTQDPREA